MGMSNVVNEQVDPVDAMLATVESGTSLIKNRDILHSTYIPNMIEHRDEEQREVTQSLLPILKQSRPSNLLVYGKPGTGKTLVVKKIISKIQEKVESSNFPIKLVYTNSKNETTLSGLLVSFGRQLDLDEKRLPPTGLSISEIFKRLLSKIESENINAIFVIDEIDYLTQLVSKTNKDILYQLTRANERLGSGSLTLVGISNDLTFKERLDPRVISTLGEEELVFESYNVDQLHKIIKTRVNDAFVENAVEDAALSLCAALAAQEHGDARRAIDLIRVAGEVAEREQSNKVNDHHIRTAFKKIEENKEETLLRSLPLHEKLVILAILKANNSMTGEVYRSYKNICKTVARDALTSRRITQILGDIELSGIISGRLMSQGVHGRTKKYTLMVSTEIVKRSFQSDLTLQDIV